ncbi:MAG: nicotinate phosphoribosyltransferase, partial [Lachnospiraceae bacterium]|nr:nicotinate phosphoribosyltransferase [Lachnospiraceae bacterium]
KLYPEAEGTFEFCDRANTVYDKAFLDTINTEFAKLSMLHLLPEEFKFVCNEIRFIPQHYWEWLTSFRFRFGDIKAHLDEEGHLHINVTDKLYRVTLYETPILAIVSECRNKWLGYTFIMDDMLKKLDEKIALSNAHKLQFSEFGMRRRFSYSVQDKVCERLKERAADWTGTSNVHMAMRHGMKVMGTHPHEWFMFHGAEFGYKRANYLALENWVNVYDGDLGIALSDTYTTDVFLKNFSRKHAKLFDGVRHDSGDPYKFVMKVINRYKELGIDPTTKTIVFSNALDFPTYYDIAEYCRGRIRCSAGIGTNLTNDCGFKASNIVMKLAKCRMNPRQPWFDTIKLSDDEGKHMGPEREVEICKHECSI